MKLNLSGFSTNTHLNPQFQAEYYRALHDETLIPDLIRKWADRAYKLPDGTVIIPDNCAAPEVLDADTTPTPTHTKARAKALQAAVQAQPQSLPQPQPPAQPKFVDVFEGDVGGVKTLVCDARSLWVFLGVRTAFNDWIARRIEEYDLKEDLEFHSFLRRSPETVTGGRPPKEYHLTIDTAKELAMVERSDQGRRIRRYFIECEKKMNAKSAIQVTRQTLKLKLTTPKGSIQYQGDPNDPVLASVLTLLR